MSLLFPWKRRLWLWPAIERPPIVRSASDIQFSLLSEALSKINVELIVLGSRIEALERKES